MRRHCRAVNEMEFRMRPPGRKECRRSVNLRASQVSIAPIDVDSRSCPGAGSSAANSPAEPTRLVSEHGDLYYPQPLAESQNQVLIVAAGERQTIPHSRDHQHASRSSACRTCLCQWRRLGPNRGRTAEADRRKQGCQARLPIRRKPVFLRSSAGTAGRLYDRPLQVRRPLPRAATGRQARQSNGCPSIPKIASMR